MPVDWLLSSCKHMLFELLVIQTKLGGQPTSPTSFPFGIWGFAFSVVSAARPHLRLALPFVAWCVRPDLLEWLWRHPFICVVRTNEETWQLQDTADGAKKQRLFVRWKVANLTPKLLGSFHWAGRWWDDASGSRTSASGQWLRWWRAALTIAITCEFNAALMTAYSDGQILAEIQAELFASACV